MSKNVKQDLAKKIIQLTDENIDNEQFIHMLLEQDTIYNLYEEEKVSFSQKAADLLAHFAGSWRFVIIFTVILLAWIILNLYFSVIRFDPFPFILLNLVLSCVAALQAPLIMMSQNRQEQKDRKRAEGDYKINLKSEIIIEDMHYKLDKIIAQQQEIITAIKTDIDN